MHLVGIDIAKYKHQCCIATTDGAIIKEFAFDNNSAGFNLFLTQLKSHNLTALETKNRA